MSATATPLPSSVVTAYAIVTTQDYQRMLASGGKDMIFAGFCAPSVNQAGNSGSSLA